MLRYGDGITKFGSASLNLLKIIGAVSKRITKIVKVEF